MIFFFDCFDGRDHHADASGVDLRSEAEAGEEADALVHALMGEALARGSPEAAWVSVRSADGRAVYSARLSLSRSWAPQARPEPARPEKRRA